jgi:hypothetical protein
MPVLNIENLDDAIVYDGIGSFIGGQASGTRANLLGENESAQLINCDVTRTGELRTRRGTLRLANAASTPIGGGPSTNSFIQALAYYDSPSASYPIATGNEGSMWKWDGADWVALGSYTHTGGLTERIIMVMGAGGKLFLIFPGQETAIKVWNGTAWSSLGTTTNAHPPPNPRWMVWHTGRLIVSGGPTEPEAIYFSQFLDGTVWDRALWSLTVSGDGIPVTGLCPWTDFRLIVMKRNSLWYIDCNPQLQVQDPSNTIAGFEKKPIHLAIGCLAPATACQVGGDVYMLTTSGVRSVQRTLAAETQTDIGDPLSYPIQDIIDRINPAAIGTANATFWNNRYFLALPLDSATQPNFVAVYNVLTSSWHGTWTGWTPTCWSFRTVNGVPRLLFGQTDGTVVEWLDYVTVDNEVDATYQDINALGIRNIPTTVLTKAFDHKEPVCKKQGFNCQFEFYRSFADVTVQIIRDGGDLEAFKTFSTVSGSVVLPVELPFLLPSVGVKRRGFGLQQFPPYRELQYKLTTASKKLVLRSIVTGAFINTVDIEI